MSEEKKTTAAPAQQRPTGDRPQRPASDRPQRPAGDRPQRPAGDRPQRPAGDRPQRPTGDRPQRSTGDRPQRPAGGPRRSGGAGGRFQRRRKFCKFCADKSLTIDHKDPDMLRSFVTERYKILPSRVTGTCAAHQRRLTTAIKRARVLALLAFTPLHHD